MASLVMTIESSDDEAGMNTSLKNKDGPRKEKHMKMPSNDEIHGDLVMAGRGSEDPNDALFVESSDGESDELGYKRKEDGSKAATWSFKEQMTADNRQSRQTGQETDDTSDNQKAVFTMQDRVRKHMRIQDVQIDDELKQLEMQGPGSDGRDEKGLAAQVAGADAKQHYDQDDLIQFHELMLSKPLVRACTSLDYDHPTIIQRQTIPAVLEGQDILAHSVTGSGKTAAYLLPMLQKYLRTRQTSQTELGKLRYLILQPTRELAAQSHSMLQNLAKYMPQQFTSCAVFGGSSLKDDKRKISSESPDVIVATTGRLIDHIHNTKGFTLEDVEMLVLDEADRLLEMGFKDELMAIVKQCRHPKRQTLMVSATLNQDLKELAQLALKKPLTFSVDKQQRKSDLSNIKLTQYLVRLQFEGLNAPKKDQRRFSVVKKTKKIKKKKRLDPDHPDFDSEEEYGNEAREYISSAEESESEQDEMTEKNKENDFVIKEAPLDEYLAKREATLIALLARSFRTRVIIFANEKVQCTRLMALLTMYGFKAAEVHGNLSQPDRLKAVESFQSGQVDYLVATDLIARGLDISSVKAVINFSFPTEPKRYLHRIGRTARAGQHGVAITLCNEEERKDLKKLSRKLNQNVNTFTIQNKFVEPIYTTIATKLAKVVSEIQCEVEQEREMQEAMKELERSENLIKYKDEIKNRPKKEWIMGKGRKNDIIKESKGDLKTIKDKFESQLGHQESARNKRQKKRDRKENKKSPKIEQTAKPKIFKKKKHLGKRK